MIYTQHPLSAAYPSMTDVEFQSLKDSIEAIGVQTPIVIFEGQVIDGWNRYKAAIELGVDCPTVDFQEGTDPIDFVKAMNDARRHLTASQKAIAIVAIYKWVPSNIGRPRGEIISPLEKTNDELAHEAGVSKRTIQQAKIAQTAGLTEAVKDGALRVDQAARIASGKPAKPEQKPEVEEEGAPDQDEFDSFAASEKAEADAMRLLLSSDQPLADMTEKYKQQVLVIERLNSRIVGLQNQSMQQIKTIKSLQNKLKKLEQIA